MEVQDGDGNADVVATKAKIFVSYSRRDREFADELVGALNARGFTAFLDTKDIAPGEPWEERLGQLILGADVVVFAVSPDSIASRVCLWEIAETERLEKRILPVVCRSVQAAEVPSQLARLNWIDLTDASKRANGVGVLSAAIEADIGWIREHTRLGELAGRWKGQGRVTGKLLRGRELSEAERWLRAQPRSAPSPTELHRSFIVASQQGRVRRRSWAIGGTLAVVVVAGGLAWLANVQRERAEREQQIAVEERDRALVAQSRRLADFAAQHIAADDAASGVLLALAALPDSAERRERPIVTEAVAALQSGLEDLREKAVLKRDRNWITAAGISGDGRKLVTAAYREIRVWDTTKFEVLQTIGIADGHKQIKWLAFSPDGRRVVGSDHESRLYVWGLEAGGSSTVIEVEGGAIVDVALAEGGTRILTISEDSKLRVWEARSGRLVGQPASVFTTKGAARSPDGKLVAVPDGVNVKLRDARTGQDLAQFKAHDMPVRIGGFSPDGALLVTTSWVERDVKIWQAGNLANLVAFKAGQGADYLKSLSSYLSVPMQTLKGHTGGVQFSAFSADGRTVITGSIDKTARIWSVENGELLVTLKAPQASIKSVMLSADGQLAVTIAADGHARVWSTERKRKPPTAAVADGAELIKRILDSDRPKAKADKDAGQYSPAVVAELVARAKSTVPRCLTVEQNEEFLLGPVPARWCIETAKWPYHTTAWRGWLRELEAGKSPSVPSERLK